MSEDEVCTCIAKMILLHALEIFSLMESLLIRKESLSLQRDG